MSAKKNNSVIKQFPAKPHLPAGSDAPLYTTTGEPGNRQLPDRKYER
jgi:hypothetical protein